MSIAEERKLPIGWKWAKLRDVCHIASGSTPQTGVAEYWNGDICWVTPTDLGKLSNLEIYDSARKITKAGYDNSGTELIPPASIVLSSRAPIGHLGIAKVSLCTNQGCKSFVPGPNIETSFLYYALKISVKALQSLGSGATFVEVSKSQVENFEIPLPPLPEQTRIAAILTEKMAAVEKARAAAEARLEAAKALPAAYLKEVFESEEVKKWTKVKIKTLSNLGPDNGVFKRREDFGQGVPIVNVSDLYKSIVVDLNKAERVSVTERELIRYSIAPGDLFFCRSSLKREGIGWCCYVRDVSEAAVFDCHVMRIRLNHALSDPEYIAYYWRHPRVREEVIGKSRTATMTTMNQADLGETMVPLPPVEKQKKIAEFFNKKIGKVENMYSVIEQELLSIKSLPSALLRRAFNGEL